MTLRVGQKVTLSGTVQQQYAAEYWDVAVKGSCVIGVHASCLTPVVDPEPPFTPGDVVSIDGVNYMLRKLRYPQGYRLWCGGRGETMAPDVFSRHWSEGRVQVIHRKGETQ